MQLQASFDRYQRGGLLGESRNTFNLDFQHRFAWASRHDIVWGASYRNSGQQMDGNLTILMNPAQANTNLFSSFIEDEISLKSDTVSLTLGSKLEHNSYTGTGAMPRGRLLWKISERNALWTAISRGIRTPASLDTAIQANLGGFVDSDRVPVIYRRLGNPLPRNEDLLDYETGYRSKISHSLSIDVSGYYNSYGHLVSIGPGAPFAEDTPGPFHVVLPQTVKNLMSGESHGLEAFAKWKLTDRWSLTPAYTWERLHLHTDPRSQDVDTVPEREENTPHHWASLFSHISLHHDLAWDFSGSFLDRLFASGVPSYTRLDSQLSWQANERLSFSAVGQNLLQSQHVEFIDFWSAIYSSQITRGAYARMTLSF
jgi:iron complex outermembrane recepter protein